MKIKTEIGNRIIDWDKQKTPFTIDISLMERQLEFGEHLEELEQLDDYSSEEEILGKIADCLINLIPFKRYTNGLEILDIYFKSLMYVLKRFWIVFKDEEIEKAIINKLEK